MRLNYRNYRHWRTVNTCFTHSVVPALHPDSVCDLEQKQYNNDYKHGREWRSDPERPVGLYERKHCYQGRRH